jgi:uncharacterized protein DUF4193
MPTNDLDEDLLDESEDMPEDLDEEDLELDELDDEDVEDLDDDDLEDDVEVVDLVEEEEIDHGEDVQLKAPREDDDEDEEEDEDDTDDVEASLDVILKERLVVEEDDDEEDDEEVGDVDERGESPLRVLPKQPGEFVCQSCFLVKHPSQLADEGRLLCRDCV